MGAAHRPELDGVRAARAFPEEQRERDRPRALCNVKQVVDEAVGALGRL